MPGPLVDGGADYSFLAPPGQACDWRKVLAVGQATRLGLLDRLPGLVGVLAEDLATPPREIEALLEILSVWDIVARDADDAYRVGPGAPGVEESAVLAQHARVIRQWAGWWDPSGAGGPGPRRQDHGQVESFLRALAPGARRSAPAVVDACLASVPEAGSVLDLGGGHGEYSLEFRRRGMSVVLQDRPEVVEVLGSAGELPGAGVRLFPGDLFETVAPGPFDIVFCAGVTDSYEAESVVRLLGQARSAMTPGGRVVLMSFIRGSHPAAVFFSVMMTASGSRADTHTEADYRRWLAANSLHLDEVVEVEEGRHTLLVASEEQ